MSYHKTTSKKEREKAYFNVFGAALEANAKYQQKVGGIYTQQIRKGKTKSERTGKPRSECR